MTPASAHAVSREPLVIRPTRLNRLLAAVGEAVFPWRLVLGLAGAAAGAAFVSPGNLFGRFETIGVFCSLLVVACGLMLRAWGSGSAGNHTRTSRIEAPQLITYGPYAYVRNPIYLGSIILGFGMVGLLGDPWLLAIHNVVFAAMYFVIIPAEERFLREQFPAEFPAYCAGVPRLIPRLRRWHRAEKTIFSWKAARGESGIALLLILIYATLRGIAQFRGTL